MRLSAILLFLHLWRNVEVSFSLNTCSPLPDVPHAFVSEETKKDEYQEADVIHFTCEPGYTSSQPSKYVCTRDGWLAVRQGKCYSCSPLPDVPHALVSDETKKDEYQEGDVIDFTCEPGYTSSQPSKYVCTRDGWLAVRQGKCYLLTTSCDPPPVGSFTVKGLPGNDEPIGPDHIIRFSCDDPGKLNGSSVLICGEDGQWNTPFPSCIVNCKVGDVPSNVYTIPSLQLGHQLRKGEKLRFGCSNRRHFLRGNAEVQCLPDGQWSDSFPTCGDPAGCGNPPGLVDGDTVASPKYQYSHGERVQYTCQNYFTMEGGPYKTCSNGQWTGEMRCLKPCTVNKEIMDRHNIAFRFSAREKLYLRHNQELEFICSGQARHDRAAAMRQRCVDGVITLPRCR